MPFRISAIYNNKGFVFFLFDKCTVFCHTNNWIIYNLWYALRYTRNCMYIWHGTGWIVLCSSALVFDSSIVWRLVQNFGDVWRVKTNFVLPYAYVPVRICPVDTLIPQCCNLLESPRFHIQAHSQLPIHSKIQYTSVAQMITVLYIVNMDYNPPVGLKIIVCYYHISAHALWSLHVFSVTVESFNNFSQQMVIMVLT